MTAQDVKGRPQRVAEGRGPEEGLRRLQRRFVEFVPGVKIGDLGRYRATRANVVGYASARILVRLSAGQASRGQGPKVVGRWDRREVPN